MKKSLSLQNKTILVTGSPGFIGANLVKRLLTELSAGTVISLDSMNDYYSPALKEYRLEQIRKTDSAAKHIFIHGNIADKPLIDDIFERYKIDVVVNLAAQAGVRYSIARPEAYITSNITGFFNILEACRHHPVEHLVFASSSSVYGANTKIPFSEDDMTDSPVSLYAATKKSNELLAYSYAKLYGIPTTGLRFFTVYGPAGRPDMFYYSAAEKLSSGKKIRVFNHGKMSRDFTYIDDAVEGVFRVMQGAPAEEVPYAVYNIGGGHPEKLLDFIRILKEQLVSAGVLAADFDLGSALELTDMQPGDVPVTFSDVSALERDFGFVPQTRLTEGLCSFAAWYASEKELTKTDE